MSGNKHFGPVGLLVESIRGVFDWRMLLFPFLVFLLGFVGAVLAFVPALPFFAVSVLFAETSLDAFLLLFLAGGAVFALVLFVASSVIEGFYLKSVDSYLGEGKFLVVESLRFALGRWKTLFGIGLLRVLVGLAVVLLVFVPIVVLSWPLIESTFGEMVIASLAGTDQAILEALAPLTPIFSIGVIAITAIGFFVRPLLFLWMPAAVFEKKSVVESARRALGLSKKAYLKYFVGLFFLTVLGLLAGSLTVSDIPIFSPAFVAVFVFSLWVELAAAVYAVKAFREARPFKKRAFPG